MLVALGRTTQGVIDDWALAATAVIEELGVSRLCTFKCIDALAAQPDIIHFIYLSVIETTVPPICSICNKRTYMTSLASFSTSLSLPALHGQDNFTYHNRGFVSAGHCTSVLSSLSCLRNRAAVSVVCIIRRFFSPCCVKHTIHGLFHIFVLSYWNKRRTMLTTTIHHDHAIKVDAVAESYLNVGGICCLVL